MKPLEAQGLVLVSVSEGINSKTASGKLQRNMTLAIGEYQLDQLREATKTASKNVFATARPMPANHHLATSASLKYWMLQYAMPSMRGG